ncbi:MAG: hypothetical protein Q607_CBUC00060G0004 [Clostridium butyricum DORA_1]|jgi:hypothetical protein|nr:MAG: hypothetical protein Q607_CBUC00060G0004 [Clostridium butyricum DORA_1]
MVDVQNVMQNLNAVEILMKQNKLTIMKAVEFTPWLFMF